MRLFIISGLSGSGKSIALQVLEDLGAYCIDNLPVGLLPAFAAQMPTALNVNYENAAVGIDARNLVHDFAHFPDMLNNIKSQGVDCEIFFLGRRRWGRVRVRRRTRFEVNWKINQLGFGSFAIL